MSRARPASSAAAVAAAAPMPPPPRALGGGAAAGGALCSDIPHFTIDLSSPPSARWSEVVRVYAPYWSGMVEQMWAEYEEADEEEARQIELEQREAERQQSGGRRGAKRAKHSSKKESAAAAAAAAAAARAARHADRVAFSTNLSSSLLASFRREGVADYAAELEAVAAASGISVSDLVLLNLSYESHGGCTSVVLPLPNGQLMLGRTLDWQQPALRHLTIELSFVRDGKLLYRATSFAGFLAIFTGHVPNGYAVSVNFRCVEEGEDEADEARASASSSACASDEEQEEDEQGGEAEEAKEGERRDHRSGSSGADPSASLPFSWPVGYLVRHTLECCTDYDSATARLRCAPLMSPAYFTVCGVARDQAMLITRHTHLCVNPIQLRSESSDEAATVRDAKGKTNGAAAAAAASVSAAAAAAAVPAARPSGLLASLGSYLPGCGTGSGSSGATGAPSAAALRALPAPQPSAHPWLVQANMDHWLKSRAHDHQESLPRTRLAHRVLQQQLQAQALPANEARMWQLLALDPIWDDETIYATVSVPAADRFVTLVNNPHPQDKKAAKAARGRRKK